MGAYGPVLDEPRANLIETDVDRAVIRSLMTWLPTYLAIEERKRDLTLGTIARPKDESFQNALTDTDFPDGRLPGVVVTTARATNVQKNQYGYDATYLVTVSVIARGRTAPESREVAAIFGGCVKAIMHDQQTELEADIDWTGGAGVVAVPDETDQGRYLAASVQTFNVMAEGALAGEGPMYPSDPYEPADPTDPDAPFEPRVTVRPGGVTTTVLPKE